MEPDTILNQDLHLSLDGFQEKLLNNLYSQWKDSQLCDLSIQSSGGTVRVHSCLLAAFSPTIADILAKLDGKFHEKQEKSQKYVKIVMDHLNVEVIKSIVASIYTGQLVISSSLIKELLETCRWLRMQELGSLIEQIVVNQEKVNQRVNQSEPCDMATTSNTHNVTSSIQDVQSGHVEKEVNSKGLGNPVVPSSISSFASASQQLSVQRDSSGSLPTKSPKTYSFVSPSIDSNTKCTISSSAQKGSSTLMTHSSHKVSGSLPTKFTKSPSTQKDPSTLLTHLSLKVSQSLPTKSAQTQSTLTSSVNSNNKCTESTSTNNSKVGLIHSPPKSSRISINQPLLSVLNQSSTENGVKSSSTADGSDIMVRRGNRQRKKTKKWEESYLFSPHAPSPNFEIGTLSEYSVPLIKVEVDDLSSFLSSADQLNFLHYNESFLSVPDQDNEVVPNANSSNGVNADVLDGSVEIKMEMTDDMLFNVSENCEATIQKCPETNIAVDNHDLFSCGSKKEKSDASHVSPDKTSIKRPEKYCTISNGEQQSPVLSKLTPNLHQDRDDKSLKEADNLNCRKQNTLGQIVAFKPYKCQKCFIRFDAIDKYNEHVNNHPVYSCQECPLFFYNKGRLTNHHLSVHLKNSHLICKDCSYNARSCKALRRHSIQEHNQPRPFVCSHPECSFRTHRHYSLLNHEQITHASEKKCVCCYCGKLFVTDFHLKVHHQSCLRTEEHLCDLCGAVFNLKTYLVCHKNTVHHNIKNYKCKHCFKRFSNGANLRRHLRIHNNIYPYSCPVCNKKFRHSNSLKSHLDIHRREGVDVENPYNSHLCNYKHKKNGFKLTGTNRIC